ncbi:MAG: sugar transferase [Planctomycetes bacterium]|nr:sugar transferase [Planctomycetota bacterium]
MTSVADRGATTHITPALVERLPPALRSRRALAWTLRMVDLALITLLYHVVFWLRTGEVSTNLLNSQRWLVVAAVLMGTLYLFDTYRIVRHEARWRSASRVVLAVGSAGVLIGLLVYLVGPELLGGDYNVIGRTVLIPALGAFAVCAIAVRGLARRSVERLAGRIRWLVLGTDDSGALGAFRAAFARQRSPGELVVLGERAATQDAVGSSVVSGAADSGAAVSGAADSGSAVSGAAARTSLDDLERHLQERWSGVIIAGGELSPALVERLMQARLAGLRIYDLAEFSEQLWQKIPVHHLSSGWLALASGFTLLHEPASAHLKRLGDVLIAGTMLLCALPFMLVLWAVIRLSSTGPGLFAQSRVGLNGRIFTCYKFRSMVVGADTGDIYTGTKDARVTTLGRIMRKTRLDELPQLWNVLIGDMSFIGPRAEWTKCVAEYEHVVPYYHLRHLVRPGLTGWAQVNYPYGASVDDAREKLEYDLYYLKNHSLALDLVILVRTVRVVLFGTGAR